MSKYIHFDLTGRKTKTNVWEVVADRDGALLGTIQWFARWRGYAFFPGEDLVFEQTCLRDIADFCVEQNKSHRKHNKAVREDKRG